LERNPSLAPYRKGSHCREPNMKTIKVVLAGTALVLLSCSAAFAQQSMTGTISKVDEAGGKIAIQQTQSGTVGASTSGNAEEFKVQDGLVFMP
jgi:Cu/Ag efflux protein CusF